MGFLDNLFGTKVSNPALVSALETYVKDASDDHIADLWQKFLKAKVLLITSPDGKSAFGKAKQIRDAISLPFSTHNNQSGEVLLAVFSDNEAMQRSGMTCTHFVQVTGEEAYTLSHGKGLNGLMVNPGSENSVDMRCWHHAVFIEKLSDAAKLQALGMKYTRAGLHADAEGVLKSAIAAAQKEPGPQHPFTGELNLELARSMRAQNKLTEAEWVYRRALSIYEVAGSHDLEVASTSEALGTLYIENKKTALATPLLTRALEIFESVPGSKPDIIGRILCQLAEIKLEDQSATEAEHYYKRASISLEERKHPDLASVLNKMGSLCESENRPKEALAHYNRTLSLSDGSKRYRDTDMAFAAHRSATILIDESQFAEVHQLLERAMEIYKRESRKSEVTAIESLLQELDIKKKKVEEEAKAAEEERAQSAGKSRFGGPGKRPAELPLLDMASMKGNSKAKFVDGKPEAKEDEERAPENPEEEALRRMRAFLDNVESPKVEEKKSEKSEWHIEKDPKVEETVAAVNAAVNFDLLENATLVDQNALSVEELFGKIEEPQVEEAKVEEAKVEEAKVEEPQVEEPQVEEAKVEEAAVKEPAANVNKLFEKPIDGEISMVFNRSVLGKLARDDRYDKPVSQRLAEQAKSEEAEATAEETVVAESPKEEAVVAEAPKEEPVVAEAPKEEESKSPFTPVAREISSTFNKSMLKKVEKSERFDKPISERPVESEVEAHVEAETDDADSLFAPEQTKEQKQEKLEKQEQQEQREKDEAAGLFSDEELDGSLSEAFAGLLADPKAVENDRFSIPVSERLKAQAEAKEEPKPQPKKDEKKEEPAAAASLFADDELDGALGEAFASVLADPKVAADDRFSVPVSERLKQKQEEPQVEPKPAAVAETEQEDLEQLMRQGTALVQQQKLDEAIKLFDKVCKLSPNDPKPWYCKGSSLHLKNQFEDALYCFNHVLNLEKDNAKAMLRKAECLLKLGRVDQGMSIFDRLLLLQPKMTQAWLSKARALLQQRRLEDALDCYKQVLIIEPANEEANKAKNLIESKLGAAAAN